MTDVASTSTELWQGYSEQGEPVGSVTLDQARSGALHGSAHVWVWHHDGDGIRVMLQVRGKHGLTWPSYLDASAAGHIDFGETPLVAAVRETSEEVGAHISAGRLRMLFVHRQNIALLDSKVIENEFQWVYGLQLDPREHFKLAAGEVDGIQWLPLARLQELAEQDPAEANLVPHGPVYFAELFRAIELLREP